MCMLLYLNGDGDVRGSHVSLFLVIQREDYDAILHWPFSFKTTFCLIDQLQLDNNQHDIVKSFWPDKNSICFQCPNSSMNGAYGIKKLCSIEQLKKDRHLYIQDDTMFIKIKVDFLTERPSK
jgi:TNF receptor-associated factor 2